jgi:aspartate ammonia-lyase
MRKESDFLGTVDIPNEALYGIHSYRAMKNFPLASAFPIEWYQAIGQVKLAIYNVYEKYKSASLQKFKPEDLPFSFFSDEIITVLSRAAQEVSKGEHFEHFIVQANTGGAGTSQNMNVNEIIANRALELLNHNHGNYSEIHPIEHANIYQSTNDVIPTALKTAVMQLLNQLEDEVNQLRSEVEKLETKYRNTLRIAYTQMQQAVPSTYGRLFSAYNEALSRDWWRISKCFERIKQVNIGGSAVGTALTVPRFFLMETAQELSRLTDLPLTRSENLTDATQNLDSLVEVHAILKSHAVNIEKMSNDIRLLAADVRLNGELKIPQKQAGSSIMPGKVNPVITEYAISTAHIVYNNDNLISSLSGQGCLDLNAYIPTIGTAMINSLKYLIAVNQTLRENLFSGIEIDAERSEMNLYKSPASATALLPYIGYENAGILAKEITSTGDSIFRCNERLNLIPQERLDEIMKTENLVKEGFIFKDLQ